MCHNPNLASPSDWLEICFNQSEARGVTIHIPFDSILIMVFWFWIFWLDYPICCTITHKEAVMFPHKWLKTSRGHQPHGFVRPCLRTWHWQEQTHGNTQGVVEKQNFNHATQNGVWTPSLLSQKHQLEKHFITVLFYERIAHLTKKFTRDFDTKGFCSCI